MNNVTGNKFTRKFVIDSKRVSKSFDDESRCNDRIVRLESTSSTLPVARSYNKIDASSQAIESDKRKPSLLRSSPLGNLEQPSPKHAIAYADAFNDIVDDFEDVQTEAPSYSPASKIRTDCKSGHDTSHGGARPKTHGSSSTVNHIPSFSDECAPPITYSDAVKKTAPVTLTSHQSSMGNQAPEASSKVRKRRKSAYVQCSASERVENKTEATADSNVKVECYYSIREQVKKMLLDMDAINSLEMDHKSKKNEYSNFIRNVKVFSLTDKELVEFIKKISKWQPIFKYLSWTNKSIIHHKFRLLGVLCKITTEDIECLQVKVIESLKLAIISHAQLFPGSVNIIGLSGILSDVASIKNDDQVIEFHLFYKSMITELLTGLTSYDIKVDVNLLSSPISAISQLITQKILKENDQCAIDTIDFLLEDVVKYVTELTCDQMECLLVSLKYLFKTTVMKNIKNDGMNIVMLLLQNLDNKIIEPEVKQIAVLLEVVGTFLEKNLIKDRYRASTLTMTLVDAISENATLFKLYDVVNMLYALSAILEQDYFKDDTPTLMNAIISFLPVINKNIGGFNGHEICMLVRSLGRIIDINNKIEHDITNKFYDIFEMLLGVALIKSNKVSLYNISMLLWGIKAVITLDKLSKEAYGNMSEIFYLTCSYIKKNDLDFSIMQISIILNCYGLLMDNKRIKPVSMTGLQSRSKSFDTAVYSLLHSLLKSKETVKITSVDKTLRSMSKSIIYLSNIDARLVNNVFNKFISILMKNKDEINTQIAYSIIISVGTMMRRGCDWTNEIEEFTDMLLTLTNENVKNLSADELRRMFSCLTVIGMRLKSLKHFIFNIMQNNMLCKIKITKDKTCVLSSLTYFYSWYYEEVEIRNAVGKEMKTLLKQIEHVNLENKEIKHDRSISMTAAKFWLGMHNNDAAPSYISIISITQKHLLSRLRKTYPGHKIHSEVSLKGMSPVDIAFLDVMLLIESDGIQHYLNNKERILDGRSISKMMAYIHMGYTVIRIHASDCDSDSGYISLCKQIDAHIQNIGLNKKLVQFTAKPYT